MGSEKEGPQGAGLPTNTASPQPNRRQGKLRKLIAPLFAVLVLYHAGLAANSFYKYATSGRHENDLPLGGSGDALQGYFDRLTGSSSGEVGSLDHHQGRHAKHRHEGKHHKHGKHDHDHEDKHGKGKGKKGKHGHGRHGGPPRWVSPKEAEEIFLSVPNNDSIRADLKKYTANAHPAGSGFDYITALQVKSEWERSLGLAPTGADENVYEAGSEESQNSIYGGMTETAVWIDTYYPILNTPVSSSVTLLSDPPVKAKLQEDIVEGDPDSVLRDEVPVFHGLSVSGDVTGQVVYVGYGRKRDFDALQARGVDFAGKIALVKYGGVFRGLKIKGTRAFMVVDCDPAANLRAAQEAGAVGCLIFTDPGDDFEITEENGYAQYPDGPARQSSSVQRGSVQFLSTYPGDPSTPGEPAYKNASRVEGGNQPSIPSLPISYEDAIPILKALKGHGSPAGEISEDWVGGLGYYGVEYFTGPSELELHFVNEVNTRVMPIWNTMAVIPGHISDEVLVIGNHRDAWVLGAGDPNSGTAAHNEMVKGFGALLEKGWKPLRTIVLASWDAEEYGLIGSTEWAEDFGDWLKEKNAVYLNVDVAVSGPNFKSEASPSLAWLIRRAAEQIQSHAGDGNMSAWDTRVQDDWRTWRILDDEFERLVEARSETGVKALGSGSDYTAFLQRYGVASGDIGYSGGPGTPVYHYHSIYDSFTWQDKYGDPGFHKHVEASKILGLLSLRVADSLVLPLNTTQYAIELQYYLEKVQHIADSTGLNEGLNLTSLGASIQHLIGASQALDVKTTSQLEHLHKLLPPPPPHPHPHPHPHGCHSPRVQLKQAFLKVCAAFGSDRCEKKLHKYQHHHDHDHDHDRRPRKPELPKKRLEAIKKVLAELRAGNKKRQAFEGGFISEQGIKDREWYKHKGTAPGIWLGYGATTFPALTEALTIDKSTEMAQKEADELTEMITAMATRLAA